MKNPLKRQPSLDDVRHTLAHLLAAAVLVHYPDAKPTLGPSIENGFYYDFDFGDKAPSDKDLPKIEATMREILPQWTAFSHNEVPAEKAREHYKDNEYKRELIDEIVARNEPVTLYTVGDFTDLCRGGHVDNPAHDIAADAFTLTRLAGAYWRGDENNLMLTRIYGLAFGSKKELNAYQTQQEEAKKRDHRVLGKALDLFTFSDLVGGGLPLWTPNGMLVRELLDNFVWELRRAKGYEKVDIPHITKRDLYEMSGHWEKFGDELFRVSTREGHEFVIKPMNCPHHTQIYARRTWSYRDLPQRYCNTTMVYRDEQSGELSGLTRVRSITQDDAHVFCRFPQVKEEIAAIWDIVDDFYGTFGFPLEPTLSLHDPKHQENYLGDAAVWEQTENMLRELAKERKVKVREVVGEAAFYGPKLDFIARDSLGREWQVGTIQLDMNMPERFDLTCTNEKGEAERIVILHAAIMGALERFLAILIEHTAGQLPIWLSPKQIAVLPIAEAHKTYAREVAEHLRTQDIRVHLDGSDETLGKKIRSWKLSKTPYALVIGDEEVKSKKLTLEPRDGKKEKLTVDKLLEKLQGEISDKK